MKLINIELVNSLSYSNSHEGIPDPILNNYFILTYNRKLTDQEYNQFKFSVMKGTFTKDNEYKIINKTQLSTKNAIVVEVEVEQNRKITKISTEIGTEHDTFDIANAILVSQSYSSEANNNASKSITENMEKASNFLNNSKDDFLNKLIIVMK